MDKNLLTAVVLSIGVYAAWFAFMERRAPPVPPARQTQQSRPVAKPPPPDKAVSGPHPQTSAAPPKETPFSLPYAEMRITSRGAAISSYRYQGPLGPVELVEPGAPGLFATWPDLDFTETAGPTTVSRSMTFSARHPAGFEVRKEYEFPEPGRLQRLRLTLSNRTNGPVELPAWSLDIAQGLGTVSSEKKENSGIWRAVGLFPPPQGRTKDQIQPLKAGTERREPWRWLAVDNRYFIAAAVPPIEHFERFRVDSVKLGEHDAPRLSVEAKPGTLPPGASAVVDIPFYLGPKGYIRLHGLGLGLERSVDFGWFDSIGRFMLKLLQRLKGATGNYGWAIILLTMLLQVVLFPLTYKSLKAGAAMKTLQPEISRLQQKYKDNPQRLNTELMALYKTKGANPLGGCLPMLAQMPVFIALFNTLRNAWELHGAPWILWIHDLSSRDPWYVLPVLMGAVMLLQNRMNPIVSGDPVQAKMMTWMPVIFTFMFVNFPAGLVLYWLTNSVLSFAQQLAIKKLSA